MGECSTGEERWLGRRPSRHRGVHKQGGGLARFPVRVAGETVTEETRGKGRPESKDTDLCSGQWQAERPADVWV